MNKQLTEDQDLINHNQVGLTTAITSDSKEDMTINTHSRPIISSWQFWGFLLALSFGGIGFTATAILLKLPTSPNCHKIYLPFTSATNRIYCAQLQAEEKTVEGLLKAIALLTELREDHPLREEINRHLSQWGNDILAIAEQEFQEGKLDEAINIAKRIPANVQIVGLVTEEIESWRAIWQKGEEININVEKKLRLGHWNLAFLEATNFLNLSNDYWKITKYQETVNKINLAREESKKLDGAYVSLRRKGIDDLLKAIQIASQIESSSYAYEQALEIIEEAKNSILESAQNLIDQKRWKSLSALAEKIPDDFELSPQAHDWQILATAGLNSNLGTVSGLELAISEAGTIDDASLIYQETQQLIQSWQLEKEDLTYLTDARLIAQPGDVHSLSGAIAKAKLINYNNPLYQEAQREIKNWQKEIEVIEDQPYLDRARLLARGNNIRAWQEAINQASLINSNRALYSQAQGLIRQWKSNIEREEDQPFLNQAIAYANNGSYQAAIDAAIQIRAGRVLSGQAQSKIRQWRREIKAQNDLNQAYRVAKADTPESLLRAINIARGVPTSTNLKGESRIAINRWSEQMLAMARAKVNYNFSSSFEEAIATAEIIPYGTSAYRTAREQIEEWKRILNPPKPPKPPLVIPPFTPIQETNFSNEN